MTRVQINEWRQRIIEAEESAFETQGALGFSSYDVRDAEGWPGCAVGEVYRKSSKKVRLILGDSWGVDQDTLSNAGPTDHVLRRLGGKFSAMVNANDFLRAYEIVDLIEARVMELRAKKAV